MLAETRRLAIADLLRSAGSVTVADLELRFGVSSMTARRDLAELERQGLAKRTHGGAVLPAISAHEDSFGSRVERDADAKAALAEQAMHTISAGESIFLDSSSTSFFVARRVLDRGLAVTLLTNSLPVMQLVASQSGPNVDLVGVGGTLRSLTQSFVGPHAVHTVKAHFADRLFMSVKGVTADGTLTDADPLEAEVKRAMIEQAAEATLLLDRSKLEARGLSAIAPLTAVSSIIAHGVTEPQLSVLTNAGRPVTCTAGGR
jgi:DeoR/GlpR family transcriptional regulator of sugar metabolism